ncbi:MAG: hypothetical protein AAF927_17780 [Bacteroidota bacterium]
MFSTKTIILFCLTIGLFMGLQAQEISSKFPLKVSVSTVMYKTHFGDYQIDVPNEVYRGGDDNNLDYRISLAYPINNRLSVGASVVTFRKNEDIRYREASMLGATANHPFSGENMNYLHSELWQRINNTYLSLFLEGDLLSSEKFFLRARLGFAYAFERNKVWHFNMYQAQSENISVDDGFFPSPETEQARNLPGLEAGVKIGYHIAPNIGISIGGNYLQTVRSTFLQPINFEEVQSNVRYANVEVGLDIQIAKLAENKRSNTLMVAVGWPFSISYERLLAERKHHHSLRVFYDKFGIYEGMFGLGYNVKIGQENHFFLLEPSLLLNSEPFAGTQLGYEFRGDAGVVVRLDGGFMVNQYDFFPRFQAHVGYAF